MKFQRINILFFSIILYAVFLFQPINLATSDLGRHIKNGQEIISANFDVLYKNYYSFSLPEQKFINHHWLSGVIFYLFENNLGFEGLHFFHSLLLILCLITFFIYLEKISSLKIASLIILPAILIWGNRVEIRPESFGYLFIIFSTFTYYFIITNKKIEKKAYFFLILQQFFWVNLHISFVYGIFFPIFSIILLIFKNIQQKKITNKNLGVKLLKLVLVLILVSLLNPNFINGLLSPLMIFSNYGYRVLENQNLWFLISRIQVSAIYLFFIIALFLIFSLIFQHKILKKNINNYYWIFLAIIGIFLGFIALRNMIIFSIFSFPFMTIFLNEIKNKISSDWKIEDANKKFWIAYSIIVIGIFVFVISGNFKTGISIKTTALGLRENQYEKLLKIENVLMREGIEGNIFNNYDLGSLIIYKFFPKQKVYVDNRPEAYTQEFFNQYILILENHLLWKKFAQENNIQVIIYGYNDITPWSQEFLDHILTDADWKQVYLDDQIIVLIKSQN